MAEARRSVCPHDCPSACALIVHLEDGRVVDVAGDPRHPFTQGVICGKVHEYADRVYSPMRVLTPLRRVGEKGRGEFEPISWDHALDEIEHRLTRALAVWGPESILPFSYGGTLGLLQFHAGHPFFHALGASQLDRTICISTAHAGWRATVGGVLGNDAEAMVDSELILLWGINAAYTHINLMTFVKRARDRGAYIVVVDPYRTRTAKQADEHVALRPGTDSALALGLMHVLITENLVDREYVDRATLGFAELSEHVRQYPPERVGRITGLEPEAIVRLARRYGATGASFIRVGIGLSRHENGGMACRSIACLPALTGAYAHPAGGALLSTSGAFSLNMSAVERSDLLPSPPPRFINMIHLGRVLTDPDLKPPVSVLFVYNSNPASVCPTQEKVLEGLMRDDLFTIVHEQMLTDTTDYADLVLPATTSMEHFDLYRSYGHLYLQVAEPVIPPQGEAKSNWEIFRLLTRAMGLKIEHYEQPEWEVVAKLLEGSAMAGVTVDRLRAERSVRVQPRPYLPLAHGAPTPSGRIELYSKSLAARGLPPLPTHIPLREGHENPEATARFPLQLIVPPNKFFLNSSFGQSVLLRRRQGSPTVQLHPEDAAARGIRDGELVRVFNDRGAARFTAVVTEDTRPGVAVVEGIWWQKFMPGGRGVNVLTKDDVTDMGGGPVFHSNLVEVALEDIGESLEGPV